MIGGFSEQKPAQATMVVSREPSVSNAVIDRPRERSTSRSRTLKVISANKPQVGLCHCLSSLLYVSKSILTLCMYLARICELCLICS